jgi:hypothetical protein
MPPIPICYVGGGQGPEPRTHLQSTFAEVAWNLSDRKVRMIPEPDALSLLRENPQDFRRCVPLADGYAGMSADQLAAMAKAGSIHVEEFNPKAGADPVPVLVLDDETAAGIAAASTKSKKKGKED